MVRLEFYSLATIIIYNEGLIKGPLKPIGIILLWCSKAFRGPTNGPPWCRESQLSRIVDSTLDSGVYKINKVHKMIAAMVIKWSFFLSWLHSNGILSSWRVLTHGDYFISLAATLFFLFFTSNIKVWLSWYIYIITSMSLKIFQVSYLYLIDSKVISRS